MENLISNTRSQISLRSRTSSSNPLPPPGGLPATRSNSLQQLYQVLIRPLAKVSLLPLVIAQ
ncbi:MAG: hypothetical protein KME35_10810 [Aphanocapsa sp. GSE-SYN-MK-11-07L]|nr:hypothetical protein [Aphanocapsa sp. GSE-SYN-MK-11-07L]